MTATRLNRMTIRTCRPAGQTTATLRPDAHELADNDRAQQQQQDAVKVEKDNDGIRVRAEVRGASP